MLQHALVDSLTADGRFAAVLAAPARVPAEMLLDLELRRFESVATSAGSAPVVHVQMLANLVDSRRALRGRQFHERGDGACEREPHERSRRCIRRRERESRE